MRDGVFLIVGCQGDQEFSAGAGGKHRFDLFNQRLGTNRYLIAEITELSGHI